MMLARAFRRKPTHTPPTSNVHLQKLEHQRPHQLLRGSSAEQKVKCSLVYMSKEMIAINQSAFEVYLRYMLLQLC